MNCFVNDIVEILRDAEEFSGMAPDALAAMLVSPPDPKMGDYGMPCFTFAKKLKKAPPAVAKDFVSKLRAKNLITEIKAVGPYLNFFTDKEKLTELTLSGVYSSGENYGCSKSGDGKTVVVDFSSPNVAKQVGVAHLLSTVIGQAICRLYETQGFKVVRVNHLGDWGKQFGAVICAYQLWAADEGLGESPVKTLHELYVRYTSEAKDNPQMDEDARSTFKKLEDGDPEIRALWEEFRELSLDEFKRVYKMLDIEFDSYSGESFFEDKLDDTIAKIEKTGIAKMSQGALIVDLEEFGMPPCLLRKSDGATTYAARDIAAALYRQGEYGFFRNLYVVGQSQELHFRQWFKVLELAGYEWAGGCIHVPFGTMRVAGGMMSTRRGNVILLDDLLNESVRRVSEIINEKNPDLADTEDVAKKVGIGAVIFAYVQNKRTKDIEFDWDRVLDFEGETGPYLNYSYARTASILRKYGNPVEVTVDFSLLSLPEERAMIRKLADYPEVLARAAEEYEPSLLSNFLLSLASDFNAYYHKYRKDHPVICDIEAVTKARVLFAHCVGRVLRNGLGILGIGTPEAM